MFYFQHKQCPFPWKNPDESLYWPHLLYHLITCKNDHINSFFVLSVLLPLLFEIIIDYQTQVVWCGLAMKYGGSCFGHFYWQINWEGKYTVGWRADYLIVNLVKKEKIEYDPEALKFCIIWPSDLSCTVTKLTFPVKPSHFQKINNCCCEHPAVEM